MSRPIELPCVQATIALVYETFRGVTRAGGVSWSEAVVIDDYGSDEQRAAARAADLESSWEQLVDDPEWDQHRGTGGFSFLDPIGFRYYIAPALIRELRHDEGTQGPIDFHLTHSPSFGDYWSLLTAQERQCICEALKCLVQLESAALRDDPLAWMFRGWEEAYRSYWMSIDENPLGESQLGL